MVAMLIVGRWVGRVDFRYLLVLGFGITAFSLWQMSNYSLDITTEDIMVPGFIQGLGLGIIFVPLSAATFATLTPQLRAQGTAVYSLIRNIGSSIGIALVQTLLVRNTQVAHASLAQQIGYERAGEFSQALNQGFDLSSSSGLTFLNAELTKQATMIAYVDNFWLMLILTLAMLPALILIKPSRPT
jgi:DHA2 family multidrug resistance protein